VPIRNRPSSSLYNKNTKTLRQNGQEVGVSWGEPAPHPPGGVAMWVAPPKGGGGGGMSEEHVVGLKVPCAPK